MNNHVASETEVAAGPATGNQPATQAQTSAVRAWRDELLLPTYLPAAPDKHPMFLEKRVYQGSSGRVYPLPFTDRIAESPVDRKWQAVWLENEFLRVLILPELGGRIHLIQDKTNGYDLLYNQPVIKPALVGLAGPWISGGIEFNWPQHHRPATFLPVDVEIEEAADGSRIVWCGDHDPMARMKGMHGVCLHPGVAAVELKARAYNRTPFTQTFLWWANVATEVHESYQSFFPPDVYYVADHARRSMSQYPLAQGFYYGVNYGERGRHGIPQNEQPAQFLPPHCQAPITQHATRNTPYAPNDLSFYANIPTPCSYMCMGSQEDFFGGYDYLAQAGIIHIANHHISPGKKQWTWGNHDFGYAWDRNLTEKNARGQYPPYIEIMAGVYTDNQPDFSFLQPGECKSWSQYWYPIQKIGPAQHANLDAAISLGTRGDGSRTPTSLRLGVCVTRPFKNARVVVSHQGRPLLSRIADLVPGRPLVEELTSPRGLKQTGLEVRLTNADGIELLCYRPKPRAQAKVPPPATEPPAPAEISSTDELYITGLHLEQYRHATRCPTLYWREALRRDPLDSRCNNALGLWHLRRGEFEKALIHFRQAIERLTRRNANPYDGEPHYNLGLCLRYQLDRIGGLVEKCIIRKELPVRTPINPTIHQSNNPSSALFETAYAAFYKATWNQAWAGPAYHALAEMDCRRGDWASALDHLDRSLSRNTENLRARDLKAIVLRKLGRPDEAGPLLKETLAADPLDWWARHLSGELLRCDLQVCLDLAHDYARAGLCQEAGALLASATGRKPHGDLPDQSWGALPLVCYTLGWLHERLGDAKGARASYERAAQAVPDYCFPARLEEIAILEAAIKANPRDARAPYYLANLLYDRRRHTEAIRLWERSARLDPKFPVVWRNLGIGYFNVSRQPARARAAYEKAFRAEPASGRVLFERDQLWKRLGEKPEKRLRELEKHPALVHQRDDLSVELCALYNQTGQHARALEPLSTRKFQPWEGGEGGPLGQHVRSHLALGREALDRGEPALAREHFAAALAAPDNLSEAKHLLANQSDIHYWLGVALEKSGQVKPARQSWLTAATFKGDFQEMSVRAFSEMTYYSALAWERLGRKAQARTLLRQLLAYARKLQKAEAKIDYFATSLPTMLLFDDDLQYRQATTALFLQAQAHLGLGKRPQARSLLVKVLRRDPNHPLAADLLKQFQHQTSA